MMETVTTAGPTLLNRENTNGISITTTSDFTISVGETYMPTYQNSPAPAGVNAVAVGSVSHKHKSESPRKLLPDIVKITHPNRTTVVYWADNTTTSVRLMEGETYDEYAAFCACVTKKLYGSTTAAKKLCRQRNAELMEAKAAKVRKKTDEKLRALAARRTKERIKRRAKELYIEEEAKKLAAAKALAAAKK